MATTLRILRAREVMLDEYSANPSLKALTVNKWREEYYTRLDVGE